MIDLYNQPYGKCFFHSPARALNIRNKTRDHSLLEDGLSKQNEACINIPSKYGVITYRSYDCTYMQLSQSWFGTLGTAWKSFGSFLQLPVPPFWPVPCSGCCIANMFAHDAMVFGVYSTSRNGTRRISCVDYCHPHSGSALMDILDACTNGIGVYLPSYVAGRVCCIFFDYNISSSFAFVLYKSLTSEDPQLWQIRQCLWNLVCCGIVGKGYSPRNRSQLQL